MTLEALRFAVEERPDPRFAHALLDAVPTAPNACAAGCAFCCHLPVLVTPAEADLLAEAALRLPGVRPRIENPTRRCAFLDAPPRVPRFEEAPGVRLEGCRFEFASAVLPPRRLASINPAWKD